jgi:protein-S-isoprenylcysteine O-methyltransferase Ste14
VNAAATGLRPAPRRAQEHLLARALPAGVFTLILCVEVQQFAARLHGHPSVTRIVGHSLYLVFIALFVALTVLRPPARAIDRRPLPWLATTVGTFGLVVSPLLLTWSGPRVFALGRWGAATEAGLALASIVGALVSLTTLGTAFSLIPQARHLVVRGPYRLVRHPMYFFEGLAMLGAMAGAGTVAAIAVTSVVLAAQVVRIHYEEQLLRTVFPDYDECFRGVAHLIPGLF